MIGNTVWTMEIQETWTQPKRKPRTAAFNWRFGKNLQISDLPKFVESARQSAKLARFRCAFDIFREIGDLSKNSNLNLGMPGLIRTPCS
jgi:hypothetical protein